MSDDQFEGGCECAAVNQCHASLSNRRTVSVWDMLTSVAGTHGLRALHAVLECLVCNTNSTLQCTLKP